jgi:hypothetical protein
LRIALCPDILCAMYIAPEQRPAELKAVTDRFCERTGTSFLKSRALKALLQELEDAHYIGLTWKEIWEALRECGYVGSYRQFSAMIRKLRSPTEESHIRTKNLAPPLAEKEKPKPDPPRGGATTGNKEKPEWQIRREETMARLDREAEENRKREARLSRPKVFNPPPFVGRGEQ